MHLVVSVYLSILSSIRLSVLSPEDSEFYRNLGAHLLLGLNLVHQKKPAKSEEKSL